MTDATIIAIVAGTAPTIAAIGAVIVGILNSKKSSEIHDMVDGNLSKVQKQLQTSLENDTQNRDRIASLEKFIRDTMKNKKGDHA